MDYHEAAGTHRSTRSVFPSVLLTQDAACSRQKLACPDLQAAFPRKLFLNYAIPESLQIIMFQEEGEKNKCLMGFTLVLGKSKMARHQEGKYSQC